MSTPKERGHMLRETVFGPRGAEKLKTALRVAAQRAEQHDPDHRAATLLTVPARRLDFVLFDVWIRDDIAAWQVITPNPKKPRWLGQNGQLYMTRINHPAWRAQRVDLRKLDIDDILELTQWLGRTFIRTIHASQKAKA